MASVASRARALPSVGPLSAGFLLPAIVVAVLFAVSLYLRTKSLGESLWMDEGLSIGIASQPLFDIPGVLRVDGSPPLYYMLLSVWMDVFGNGPGRHAEPLDVHRAARHPERAVGGLEPLRPPRRPDLRGALRGQPLPHQLRAGDPHVLAHAGALTAHHGRVPARVRLPPPLVPAGVRDLPGAAGVHAQLGAVLRRRRRDRAHPVLVRVRGPAALRAGRPARLRRGGGALPALAAHPLPPAPAHGRALAQPAPLRRARSRSPRRSWGAARPRWRSCSPAARASRRSCRSR